jgi:hypothetical protein
MSNNQTGHEQNVVNLNVLITRIDSFPAGYNPSRAEFTFSSLTQLKTNGESTIASVISAEKAFKKSIVLRSAEFSPLDPLITRAMNAFESSGALPQTVEQAKAIVRELRGQRASDKLTEEQIAVAKENGKDLRQITLHNMNIDRRIENFNKFIQFLSPEEEYNPNEEDLKIDALNTKLLALKTANNNYNSVDSALDAARLERNALLYSSNTGLVDIAKGVKLYVKSAFGATSPQYKAISGIVFTRFR